jgi:2-keto-3-deoxy-L-rhamnonate aldolase RhmA
VRENRLRNLMREGKPTLGTRLQCPWPTMAELIGRTGCFDYVEFTAEYSPYDIETLENWARATEVIPNTSNMIKVPQDTWEHLAVRAMNSGFQNLLFADIRSAEDAQKCVRAVRPDCPDGGGIHGAGMSRDVGLVIEACTPQMVEFYQGSVVALMIEKKEAVENLESILAVKGVDMVQFGPSDYSLSIGIPGQRTHPAVKEAEKHVIETALKMGVPPRAEVGMPSQMQAYAEMGVRHFSIGLDVRVLYNWFRENGGLAKKFVEEL